MHQIALARQPLPPDGPSVGTAKEKREGNPTGIKQREALVIFGKQPRLQAVFGVEIIRPRRFWYFEFFHLSKQSFLWTCARLRFRARRRRRRWRLCRRRFRFRG